MNDRPAIVLLSRGASSAAAEMSPRSTLSLKELNLENSIMPIWQADYFDKTRDQVPTRSVIIEAEYESDALDEARAGMGSPCCRAEVTRIDLNSSATIH
jgi:hypothetical protein